MSISQYLWSVAYGLRTQVRPAVEEGVAEEVLDNSIRVIATIANALEPGGGSETGLIEMPAADTDRLGGPAENAAVYRNSGAAIARSAQALDAAEAGVIVAQRDAIRWEKAAMDGAIARMDAAEYAPPAGAGDPRLTIDRTGIETYLRGHERSDELRVSEFRPIVGGRSRQTALLAVEGARVLPPRLVIQRGLPGGERGSAYASEVQQFDLLQMLHGAGMRVLREDDPEPLGAPFLITEQVAGSTAQSDYWRPVENPAVALGLAREMALLHQLEPGDLSDRLPQSRQNYDLAGWREELEQLAATWHASAHWPSVTMSATIAWLRGNIDCLEDRRCIVHNDMIFHNIMADEHGITAILDWEQASIGHPGEDLGYAYPVVCAAVEWPRFMAAYHAAGGPQISQRQVDYFALRAGLRLMNMVLKGGRDPFESGLAPQVLVASSGAHFSQRLLHRIAGVLDAVLARG